MGRDIDSRRCIYLSIYPMGSPPLPELDAQCIDAYTHRHTMAHRGTRWRGEEGIVCSVHCEHTAKDGKDKRKEKKGGCWCLFGVDKIFSLSDVCECAGVRVGRGIHCKRDTTMVPQNQKQTNWLPSPHAQKWTRLGCVYDEESTQTGKREKHTHLRQGEKNGWSA